MNYNTYYHIKVISYYFIYILIAFKPFRNLIYSLYFPESWNRYLNHNHFFKKKSEFSMQLSDFETFWLTNKFTSNDGSIVVNIINFVN